MHDDPALERVIHFWQTLAPTTIAHVVHVYASDATFEDPFNAVTGADAIARLLERMFSHLDDVHFRVEDAVRRDVIAFLRWEMTFRMSGRRSAQPVRRIVGVSYLRFTDDGLVAAHRDYWDAGLVYEQVPVLGAVVRLIRKRIG